MCSTFRQPQNGNEDASGFRDKIEKSMTANRPPKPQTRAPGLHGVRLFKTAIELDNATTLSSRLHLLAGPD